MSSAPPAAVLIIGLDPHAVPGVDADEAGAALDEGLARFDGSGMTAEQCVVPLDDTAEGRLLEALTREDYACVVVGRGIRTTEALLEFFEAVINLIRVHAPDAAIAFNTDGTNSVDAARRVLRR